ncbi:MAG: ribosome maturation factor RimM, partial [Actinomycetota bacterium]
YVAQEDLRRLGEEELWEHELVGCRALDPEGRELGRVAEVVPGGAQDLLSLDTPRGARLVPLVKDIVTRVDVDAGEVTLDPPQGLLD